MKRNKDQKLRAIRLMQNSAQATDEAYSKKSGYHTRPKPSMPKMPWDNEPAAVEQHLARGRAE